MPSNGGIFSEQQNEIISSCFKATMMEDSGVPHNEVGFQDSHEF